MLYVVFNFVDGNDDDGVQHLCNDRYVGGNDDVTDPGHYPAVIPTRSARSWTYYGADSHDVQCNVNPVDSVLCITLSCSLKDDFQA